MGYENTVKRFSEKYGSKERWTEETFKKYDEEQNKCKSLQIRQAKSLQMP